LYKESDIIIFFSHSVVQATFQSSSQPTTRHTYLSHSQSGQRFYHHSK